VRSTRILISGWALVLTIACPAAGQDAPARQSSVESGQSAPQRAYSVNAKLFSLGVDRSLDSYRSHGGSGAAGPGGTLVLDSPQFRVAITPITRDNKFLVAVKVETNAEDAPVAAQQPELDLTDLRPQTIQLGAAPDGRTYLLALSPEVVEPQVPEQFNPAAFRPACMNFRSRVIVNDRDYVGTVGMSGGEIAWLDIPGVGHVEFSLLHLKDAEPRGVLALGQIELTGPDATTITLSNVTNGTYPQQLPGGPYRVWVRWRESTVNVAQFRELAKQQLVEIKRKAAAGEMYLPPQALAQLEQMAASDRPQIMASGVRPASADDLAP
jgi:hypothetical protein